MAMVFKKQKCVTIEQSLYKKSVFRVCELSDKKLPMNAISNIKQTIHSYSK